jgi:hypothetical protein
MVEEHWRRGCSAEATPAVQDQGAMVGLAKMIKLVRPASQPHCCARATRMLHAIARAAVRCMQRMHTHHELTTFRIRSETAVMCRLTASWRTTRCPRRMCNMCFRSCWYRRTRCVPQLCCAVGRQAQCGCAGCVRVGSTAAPLIHSRTLAWHSM